MFDRICLENFLKNEKGRRPSKYKNLVQRLFSQKLQLLSTHASSYYMKFREIYVKFSINKFNLKRTCVSVFSNPKFLINKLSQISFNPFEHDANDA